ncbi:acyltransferase [Amycolatopsis suaedae]|uniref:Acyltransferase n=1 Tax=Amycolatopsis suaedae TaxID=2510978 RepID=A0A4Q7JCY1_9PSEU|nr:acyltransferase [Amycolatopsis suaedae]
MPRRQDPRTRKYRPELQGLRAVAVVLVVVYHVWLDRVSGGVDVFFVVTGFLITGQLVRAHSRGGIEFGPMWGRMIKRLFPAALTVLAVTIVVAVFVLPENRWFQTIKEIAASALYVQNWRLAADSADYFAQHDSASVVQHFWSLSIQGQFYVVWPLLIALVLAVAAGAGQSARRCLVLALTTVGGASLAYSVVLTAADQPLAYFHSLTRVWEFALGGLLAVAVEVVVLPRWSRLLLGWAGLAGLVSCGLVLRVGSVFPGYAALWPTLSAAAVILAGAAGSRLGADRLLSSAPLTYVGNLSYSLYLWHWPILVFYLVGREQETVGLAGGAVVVGVSLLLAVATHHLVEKPMRDSRIGTANRWGAYRFAALTLVPVLAATATWQVVATRKADAYAVTVGDPDHPGALARVPGFEYWGKPDPELAPSFLAVGQDYARVDEAACVLSPRHPELTVCPTASADPPARRIVVAGDSHSQQFLAALRPVAEQKNWQILSMLRGGCPFSTDSDTVPGDQPCMDWNAAVADEIAEIRPDAVFTIGTRDVRVGATEHTPPGYVAQWRKVDAAGIPVLAVRDNPRYDFAPSACVETHGPTAPECATPRSELLAPRPPYADLPDLPANVSFLDFSDYYCDTDRCPPVIGNVLLYIDDNHITATYMATMSSIVEEAVETTLGWRQPPPSAGTDS